MIIDEIKKNIEGFDWTQDISAFSKLTHSIHKYPAKLIPQIPELFISKFAKKNTCVFDPYCGSGTTLLEARKAGFHSIGFDLNPLALFISDMKTRIVDLGKVKKEIKLFKSSNFEWEEKNYSLDMPLDEALKYFPKDTIWQINHILSLIENSEYSKDCKDILLISLSDILRTVSFTRMGDFKIYMIPKEERQSFYENPEPLFKSKINVVLKQMEDLRKELCDKSQDANVTIIKHNSSKKVKLSEVTPNFQDIDLVITSPPYGDSRTTVAYGEFSWFSNRILRLASKIKQGRMDKQLMGGQKRKYPRILNLGSINKVLNRIHKQRRNEVRNFFHEYQRSIENVSSVLNEGGICCYVVGNRNVDGQQIPMDEFTRLCFEHFGLTHVGTYVRDIIGKTLSRRNNKSDLMNEEIIVVMYKPLSP